MACRIRFDDCYVTDNPVQELGQRQLADVEKDLKHVKKVRKNIQKQRKETQNQIIELERKQAIYNAKYTNSINLKDHATKEMQELRAQVATRQRIISELENKMQATQKTQQKSNNYIDSRNNIIAVSEEEIKSKIEEVLKDIDEIIKCNSTQSGNQSALGEELVREQSKKVKAKVIFETLKDRNNFVKDTKDNELNEKLRLEQQLHKVKTILGEREQQEQHMKEIIDREQMNLENVVNQNVKLITTGKQLAQDLNNQRNLINKLIRELKCAKHDEENLADMAREVDLRVANEKLQLDKELDKHNCLIKNIQAKEITQGDEIIPSSCQGSISSIHTANISSPTLSTTYLDAGTQDSDSASNSLACKETSPADVSKCRTRRQFVSSALQLHTSTSDGSVSTSSMETTTTDTDADSVLANFGSSSISSSSMATAESNRN